jgi:hypothetical protein
VNEEYIRTNLWLRTKSIGWFFINFITTMEMIGEQGMTVYQAHIQTVKTNNPKTV